MKKRYLIPIILFFVLAIASLWFVSRVIYDAPETPITTIQEEMLIIIDSNHYQLGNSWLKRNKSGNWESYIEGSAYDRGRTIGILHRQLVQDQEQIFVDEINQNVPSWFLRKFLLLGISWFNRDLPEYIPLEYRLEIYGVSEFFSDEFDFVGPKFNRVVNYHAAHDIGHAVQNMHLVGCTSVGIWNFSDSTGLMMSGRNFDFYFGDEFAKDKIVLFCNPDHGYKYLSVTWGGFCGVVSGMNEHGLSLTLNSAISEIPQSSGTPVSIIARDILQYAKNIEEAEQIASKYKSFVSELFTVSSLYDEKMVIIEKSPEVTDLYTPSQDTLIVSNHYQSDLLKDIPLNIDHMQRSESVDRYKRAKELTLAMDTVNPISIASILRNQSGISDKNLGLGNPKSINQLLAHHAVIFDNVNRIVWVSNYPFQINKFDAYELEHFEHWAGNLTTKTSNDSLALNADPFYFSNDFAVFNQFKKLKNRIIQATEKEDPMDNSEIDKFTLSNPEYYETYRLLGNYFSAINQPEKAIKNYEIALTKDIAYQDDREFILSQIKLLQE